MQQWNARKIAVLISLICLLNISAANARPVCESADSDPDGDGYGWENNDTCIVVTSTSDDTSSLVTGASLPVCQSADSDSDGDGFGWEFNASCRVVQVQNTGTAPISGKAICHSASSDSDGDGYGWESGASCIVQTPNQNAGSQTSARLFGSTNNEVAEEKITLTLPACSDERFASDGSGYGWENSRSCTFLNAGDGGRSITDIVLVTGQSNALGAETLPFDPYDPQLDSPVRRVYAHSSNGWGIAGLQQIWDRGWYPRSDIAGEPANNFAFHFAKSLVKLDSEAVVGIIMVTAPGAGISLWDRNGAFYSEINNRVRSALAELPANFGERPPRVRGILWHQGETDFYSSDFYSNRLRTLISNFRSQDWFADDGIFICGETLNSPVNERLLALNADGDPHTGCVPASDLTSIGDDVHFDVPSLRTLGSRYAEKYQSLR